MPIPPATRTRPRKRRSACIGEAARTGAWQPAFGVTGGQPLVKGTLFFTLLVRYLVRYRLTLDRLCRNIDHRLRPCLVRHVPENNMKKLLVLTLAAIPFLAAADPDPSVMSLKREADIRWSENPAAPGLKFAVLYGNPPQPGP